ncbi:hypothetical protein EVAR_10649_1 [Eumeta japonica]|uniref:Uncharacterized protein n=1 Tax=Eumeta variegata TaxID=151549 RepID=A0A4C1U799_EUMVA|nr:hypothetical protein EVAR_10649_1 [Eumeta japonica]
MLSIRAEPHGACCAQCFDRTCRFEPKSPYIKATSVPGSRTQLQHGTHFVPFHKKKRIQAQQNITLRMIAGAGRYVLNDVIARDLCIETVDEFIQRIARRMFDIADQDPYEFLRNIAPMQERSPSGRPLPRELIRTPSPKP